MKNLIAHRFAHTHRLKKLSIYTIILLSFVACVLCIPNVQAENNEVNFVRIAGDKNLPPFEYVTESGSFIGFNVDIMNAISFETGLIFEFYPMTWNEALEALRNGEVDAIQGMKYSETRAEQYRFSKPYFTSYQGIFILKDNYSIYQLEDLKHRKVALQKGDIATNLKEITGAILNVNDVTEQKVIAKKLEQEDRLRSLGKILLTLAHEIRNPLMTILTYTRILPRKIDNLQFRQFFVEHVTAEIHRLNVLVEDLLNYSKPKKSTPKSYETEKIIKSILKLYESELDKKNLKVNIKIENTNVFADLNQLKQIFINILSNAIEASPHNAEIKISSFYRGNQTIIEISDRGIGIEVEEMAHIFEPFYSNKSNGLGLGLAITYNLIQENKGTIEFQSEKGKGTTVTLKLPRIKEYNQ